MATPIKNTGKAPSMGIYTFAAGATLLLVFLVLCKFGLTLGYTIALTFLIYGPIVFLAWDYVIITPREDTRVRLINRRTGKSRIVDGKTQFKSIFEEFDLVANEVKQNPIKVVGKGLVELSDDSFVEASWVLRFMPGGENRDDTLVTTYDRLALSESGRAEVVSENINAIALRVSRSLAASSTIDNVRKSGTVERGFKRAFELSGEDGYLDDVLALGCSLVSAHLTFDVDAGTKETIQHIFKGAQNLELAEKMVEASKDDPKPLTIKEALNFLNAQDSTSNVQKTITEVEGGNGDGLMQALMQLVAAAKANNK